MKNMLKSIWFSLFISILFIGCETEEEITSSGLKINKKNESVVTNSPEVGKVQSAISFLNEHFSKKINSVKGRSNRSLNDYSRNTIDTIYSLNDQNDKPLLKLVAFKQNGYALISNIENVDNPPVLFYSTEKFEKKNVNPGLVNYIEEFINSQPKDRTAANYSLNENEYGSLGHGRETGGTDHGAVVEHLEETKEEKGPLLSTYWNQRAPYNKYCPKHNGTSTLVGCVAIAIGQIMNYHQKNTIKNYNWNKINSNFDSDAASDETAKLLHDIGVGVNMNYGVTGSGSNVKNAVKYFKNAGYKTHSIYSYEGFKKSINNSNPVYLKGFSKRKAQTRAQRWFRRWRWILSWNYSQGHAWVGDGYKEITQWEKSKVKTTKYIHMNWGWGRQSGSDGWCTYDYWKAPEIDFKYEKQMISVTPNH